MSPALMLGRMQNFAETLGETRRAKNFGKKQKRAAGIFHFCDGQKAAAKLWVGGELLGGGIEPGVDLGVHDAQGRLQLGRVAFRIVHQKTGIDAEETSEKRARAVRQVRARAAFDLREVGLAQAAAYFLFHGGGELLLGRGAAEATQGTFYGAEGTEFVAESHRRTHVLQYANTILLIAICVKNYIWCVF